MSCTTRRRHEDDAEAAADDAAATEGTEVVNDIECVDGAEDDRDRSYVLETDAELDNLSA